MGSSATRRRLLSSAIEELMKRTQEADASGKLGWAVAIRLDPVPFGFDLRYAGLGKPTGNRQVSFDPATHTLTAAVILESKEISGLLAAAGDPELRAALNELMVKANANRVSAFWLMGFFLLATLGELCVSPVGLSMVRTAPPRFAALLMGVWLLTWAFGNFLAGAFGERWGVWASRALFVTVGAVLAAVTLLLFILARKIRALMHGAD